MGDLLANDPEFLMLRLSGEQRPLLNSFVLSPKLVLSSHVFTPIRIHAHMQSNTLDHGQCHHGIILVRLEEIALTMKLKFKSSCITSVDNILYGRNHLRI